MKTQQRIHRITLFARRTVRLLSVFTALILFSICTAKALGDEKSGVNKPGERTESAERMIRKSITVHASLDDVWHAWTTSEGIASFFTPDSRIEMKIGGPYELYMGMKVPDESGMRGSEGSKVLSFIPKEMLSFEWTFPPAVMNLRKAHVKTQVILTFKELGEGQVKVDFRQVGWQEGDDWDKGYAYFDKAWTNVLNQLKQHFDEVAATKAEKVASKSSIDGERKSWKDQHVTVTAIYCKEKRQDFEMTIPVPVETVWHTLATTDGLKLLGGSEPQVELKPGGRYAFWPQAGNRVLSYVPLEMLSTSGSAPPKFPNVRKGGTWGAYFFEKVGPQETRLRLSVIGWQQGEEWDQAFDYFLKNNPVFLNAAYEKMVKSRKAA